MPNTILAALQLTVIDMMVVFAVLALLIVVIQATKALITRANGKENRAEENEEDEGYREIVDLVSRTSPEHMHEGKEPFGGPAAEARQGAAGQAEPVDQAGLPGEVIAAISSALHVYMGSAATVQIRSIRPLAGAGMDAWLVAGRGRLMRTGLGPRQRRSKSWRDVSE